MNKIIKKIKEGVYEITETREDKHIMTIETIDKNIQVITDKLDSIENERIEFEKQKVEQVKLKEDLLKVN